MRRALLVGINDYDWSPLYGCINDVKEMENVLKKHYDKKENFNCMTLTSDKDKVTKAKFMGAVQELFSREADMVLLYFSGHGHQNNLGGRLVTQDAVENSEGVSVSDIITIANQAEHIKEVIIILDCCHSGHFGSIPIIDSEKAILRKGITILTASLGNELAVEKKSKKQGLFTSILLEALKGGASNILGHITAASIYDYVEKILGPWQQRPVFKAHISEMTAIKYCQPKISIDILKKITDYFPTAEFKYKLDSSYDEDLEPRNDKNELKMEHFRAYLAEGLLVPIGYKYLYRAAENGTGCQLTPLGKFYWKVLNKITSKQ